MKKGFGSALYTKLQTEKILERIEKFDNKLYLEFGGKLFDDMHAARVLPGFEYNAKINILKKLKDRAEVIFVISAGDIERNKIRADYGITYGDDVLRLIDKIRSMGISVNSVVVTQYTGQTAADVFLNKLQRRGEKTYVHRYTKGYPTDVDTIVSDEGYGANPYIETTRPLVVVTAPGPGSGKLATCLSQLYHEYKRGVKAGYAKFETFPIWNLPLRHPVNVAYEAATADLGDVNMIDPFHLDSYGIATVNYNRDIECFPIVRSILNKITGEENLYRSPTDMGVNMAGFAITDDEIVRKSSRQEIIRRYYKAVCDYKQGLCDENTPKRIRLLMNDHKISIEERTVVTPALKKAETAGAHAVAIQLPDGRIVTGKASVLMTSSSAAVLNAVKTMADIPDKSILLSPEVLTPITRMKKNLLHSDKCRLNLADVLTALSICANDPTVKSAYDCLPLLKGCEAHSSCILPEIDTTMFRKLGLNVTCEPVFATTALFNA